MTYVTYTGICSVHRAGVMSLEFDAVVGRTLRKVCDIQRNPGDEIYGEHQTKIFNGVFGTVPVCSIPVWM